MERVGTPRRVERWLNTLPGAVALRSANAAPGLSLSASQPELAKTRAQADLLASLETSALDVRPGHF